MTDDEEMLHACTRIGLSADGQVLLKFLKQQLAMTATGHEKSGALRHMEGRRSFAAELITKLQVKKLDDDPVIVDPSGRGPTPNRSLAERRRLIAERYAGSASS